MMYRIYRPGAPGQAILDYTPQGILVHAVGTTPHTYRVLTGRTHPIISAMHRSYRQKRGKRGWKR